MGGAGCQEFSVRLLHDLSFPVLVCFTFFDHAFSAGAGVCRRSFDLFRGFGFLSHIFIAMGQRVGMP
jgi:hypothetical protein